MAHRSALYLLAIFLKKNGIDLKFPITVAQAVKSGLLEGWGFKTAKGTRMSD